MKLLQFALTQLMASNGFSLVARGVQKCRRYNAYLFFIGLFSRKKNIVTWLGATWCPTTCGILFQCLYSTGVGK